MKLRKEGNNKQKQKRKKRKKKIMKSINNESK